MSSDNNQMASSSNERPQVASTQAQNEIPLKTATRLSLPPNTIQKMVALQNSLCIKALDEQTFREFRVLTNAIVPGGAEDSFFEAAKKNPRLSAIARFNNRAVGYISCELRNDDQVLYIVDIGVLPSYRGRGIGGALMHHAITDIAENLQTVEALCLHVYDDQVDLIRLFERFDFTDFPEGQHEDDPENYLVFVRRANKRVDLVEPPPRKRQKTEPIEISIEKVTKDTVAEVRAVNDKIRDFGESDGLYEVVARFPHFSSFAILDGEKIGVMSRGTVQCPDYKQHFIMSLGVVQEHEWLKSKVIDMFLKQAINTAEAKDDIEMVTYLCKNDDTTTLTLLDRHGLILWQPHEDFYANTNDNRKLHIKPIVKNLPQLENIGNDSDDNDTDDQGTSTDGEESGTNAGKKVAKPAHRDLDMSSIDVEKLEIKTRSLRMAYVTAESLQSLKQISALIEPIGHKQQESLFKNVLEIPELTCIAFFDVFPCGYITCEKKLNHGGSSHLSIVSLGVTHDHRGLGIGGALLDRAIKVSKKMADVKYMTAIVPFNNDKAKRLFERYHFKQCGSTPEELGVFQGYIFCKPTGN